METCRMIYIQHFKIDLDSKSPTTDDYKILQKTIVLNYLETCILYISHVLRYTVYILLLCIGRMYQSNTFLNTLYKTHYLHYIHITAHHLTNLNYLNWTREFWYDTCIYRIDPFSLI